MKTLFSDVDRCFGFGGFSGQYIWNKMMWEKFSDPYLENARLFKAVSAAGQKASLALFLTITEGIVEFTSNDIDLLDCPSWLSAVWLGTIDPLYIKEPRFEFGKIRTSTDGPFNPVSLALFNLSLAVKRYTNRSYYFHSFIVNQIMMARYLFPQKKVFDGWLTQKLRELSTLSPCSYNYGDLDGDTKAIYDVSQEKIVPREFFFDSTFVFDTGNVKRSLNDILSEADFEANRYLSTPSDMIAKGFQGTPYKFNCNK